MRTGYRFLFKQSSSDLQSKPFVIATSQQILRTRMEERHKWRWKDEEMRIFDHDDIGYLAWLAENPHGFVLNTTRNGQYFMLHMATCGTISGHPTHGDTWTAGQYIKVCAFTPETLERWAGHSLPHCQAPGQNCFAG